MRRVARLSFVIPAVLAAIVLARVVFNGVTTVLELRKYGVSEFPLVAPLDGLPLIFVAWSVWQFAKDRRATAAVLGTIALAISCLFWVSQAASRGG